MSILSVDQIQPIGSGTTVTVNKSVTLESGNTNITGVCTATSFSGSGANLTSLPSQVTIANNADNRVITGGSGTNLNGEANLTFDGGTIALSNSTNPTFQIKTGTTSRLKIIADTGSSKVLISSQEGYPLALGASSGGGASEALRITTDGKLLVGATNQTNGSIAEFSKSVAGGAAGCHITVENTSNNSVNNTAGIHLKTSTGTAKFFKYQANQTFIQSASGGASELNLQANGAHAMRLYTNGNERLRITNSGRINIGDTDQNQNVDQLSVTVGAQNALDNVARFQSSAAASGTSETLVKIYKGAGYGGVISGYITQGSDHGLKFYTANNGSLSERLRINSNGYVTKPNNPAFIAGRTNGNYTHTPQPFNLNATRLNVGNHYNTSTYKFTAPVAGVYYFFAQVYYNNGTGSYRVGFRKTPNGGSPFMLTTSQHAMVGNDNQQSTSIIESLAIGDTVELYSDQNTAIQCYYNINNGNYGAHTYFLGYLIG